MFLIYDIYYETTEDQESKLQGEMEGPMDWQPR